MGSTRDGQTREAEAGEAEVAASDSGGNGGAERDNVNDEAGHAQSALEADEAADSIRLQLTVRELLL